MSEAVLANKTERAVAEFEEYKNMGYGQAYRPSSEAIETALTYLRAQENEPLTTDELVKLDIAYFVFKEQGLEHLSGWRVRKYCEQTEAHEFYGTDATYVDSRQYNDGSAGIIAYAREPKHEEGADNER